MNLIERAQAMLLRPRQTWPAVEQESATTASLYSGYLVYLAAIPAVASFIGLSLVGAGAFGISVRVPVLTGLVHMVLRYLLSLVMVYVLALIVDALAPTFGGTKSPIGALKVVAYGSTAAFVGGIFGLLPSLSVLGLLAGLYTIYLIYTGLPVLMKCPPQKAGAYTAVVVVGGIVAGLVLGAVSALVLPGRGALVAGAGGDAGVVDIKTPGGSVRVDANALGQVASKMDEARQRMEAAQKSGDSAAAGKALGDMMGAVTGGNTQPIDVQELKALLPQSLGNLQRDSLEVTGGQAMGIAGSTAKSSYASGDQHARLTITDLGGLAGMAALAGWANMTVDKETADAVEKVYKQGSRTVREEYRKDGSRGQYTVILSNGVIVETQGDGLDMAALKALVAGVDLDHIESLKRVAKP